MKNAEEIYKRLEEDARNCPFCGRKEHVRRVRIGNGDEIIAEYECKNAECKFHLYGLRSYRRMLPREVVEIKKLISEEELSDLLKKAGAAMDAEIKCPECGEVMRYIETDLLRNGKVVHELACKNSLCFRRREIKIELSDEDCEKIEARRKAKYVCGICGDKNAGIWVHCPKYGIVCERHCTSCEHLSHGTSLWHCLYKKASEREKDRAEKAKESLERTLEKG